MSTQSVLAIDLEGVLVDEIWEKLAESTGIEKFKLTTKDVEDYNQLMDMRMSLLEENNIGIEQIRQIVDNMDPFPGALSFLKRIRERMQLIILTDSFWEFVSPLAQKMNYPTVFCHTLDVDSDNNIRDYIIRTSDHKRKAVKSLKDMNFFVFSVGDSFNDTGMMKEADMGIFFRPSPKTYEKFPEFEVVNDYDELKSSISKVFGG